MSEQRSNKADMKMRVFKYFHFLLTVGLFALFWFLFLNTLHIWVDVRYNYFTCAMYAVLTYFFDRTYNCYLVGYSSASDIAFSQCMTSFLADFGTYGAIMVVWNKLYSPLMFFLLFVCQCALNIVWSALADRLYYRLNPPRKSIVLYRDEKDMNRLKELKKYAKRFDIKDQVRIEADRDIDSVIELVEDYDVVFVTGIPATLRNGIAKYCVENSVQGYFLPHIGDVIMAGAEHIQSFSVPILSVNRSTPDPEFMVLKRVFDIVLSLLGIIVLSPLMLITALAIRLYDGGPALYKQTRLTKNGEKFRIYKFRSMKVNAEDDGVARLAAEGDDRITPVGRFIRACRLDELPQLFNILKGDMSIVGPRPERPELAEEYAKILPAFNLRLQVKAGLTGYAQIYGKYNTDPYDKLEMDLLYINKMSVITDLQLIFATVKVLFIKESTEGVGKDN